MRLTCPNCDAQYEVPDDVIPAEGRDVQCSNCGNTWFQAAGSGEEAVVQDVIAATAALEIAASEPEPDPAPEPEPAPEPPARRPIDPDVASVLREEAAHEARVRAAEREGVESQPDLGLEEPGALSETELRARQARERMARMRGEDPDQPAATPTPDPAAVSAAAAAAGSSRREMLPDIEEINSTLRSASESRQSRPASEHDTKLPTPEKKGSFRRGFTWVFLVLVIALLLYLYADRISEMVPQAAGALKAYVAAIDSTRSWLDAQVLNLLGKLDGMASEAGTMDTTAEPEASGN